MFFLGTDTDQHVAAIQDSVQQKMAILEHEKRQLNQQINLLKQSAGEKEKNEKEKKDRDKGREERERKEKEERDEEIKKLRQQSAEVQKENNCFLNEIVGLQDTVVNLKREQETLVETITLLQEELSRSEQRRRSSSGRNNSFK